MIKKIIMGLVLTASLTGVVKADQPVGMACPVTIGYLQLCLQYGACIMPDCGSWEFEDEINTQWMYDYDYPEQDFTNVSRELPL